MRKIKLTQGKWAMVDNSDFDWLNQWSWFAHESDNGVFYAERHLSKKESVGRRIISMHRLILGITNPRIKADHINHNGLDNRRKNLRVATNSQNCSNRRSVNGSTSKYRGVSMHTNGKWQANICKDGKIYYLGLFLFQNDAAIAYNKMAVKLHGRFAFLNKIRKDLIK